MPQQTVEVVGNYPNVTRVRTGLFSLDYALGSRGSFGIPVRTMMELYGYTHVGKSSLAYWLAGKITGSGDAGICDVENADPEYIQKTFQHTEMNGKVFLMDTVDAKGRPSSHEDMLMAMCKLLAQPETGAVILDSVGAIQPLAEANGDFGEAFMGKRAKLVAQVSRALANIVRTKEKPSLAVVINHVHSIIGGQGHTTAGGQVLKYLAAIRIMVTQGNTYTKSDEDPSPLGFYVKGRVEKLRYGGRGGTFGYYIVPGYGVHQGASALMDCLDLGLAESSSVVKMDGKSFGYLKKDLLTYAHEGKQRKFDPFIEALQKYEQTLMVDGIEEESDDVPEVEEKATRKAKKGKEKDA